ALAGELAALLAADASADTALDTGGLAPTADLRGPRRAELPDIPGYRVREILGEGGMGTVYAAEQQAPRRPVAIKVLHALSQSALVRFRTEAEIMARLDHPGIARVLEAGDAGGHPFLVMEHVDGVTLDRYVEALPRAHRLQLFAALCEAVHHAHVKGVIHRDLKPSNVMVRPGDRIVVLDFGVARLAAADGSASGDTRAGELLGTPLYMSPEQARLRPDEVDARSDVYTLGVMLYELACGELPYDIRGMPLPAVALAVVEDEPVMLSRRDPGLRGDLEAIAMTALRKDPTERYQSAAALGDDVRRLLAGLPVSVRTPGTLEQLRRFMRRRPLIAGAIASALIAAATFAIVVTRLWLAAGAARATAEAAQHRTEQARADLEVRTNELTLRQARAAVARDPTEAIAWLATLVDSAPGPGAGPSRTLDANAAWGIVDEALGRGVASHVLRGHTDEVHWIEPMPGAGTAPPDFVTGGYDGRVILWQAPAYTPRIIFQARRGRVHVARPSPDGAVVAVGVDDGELHLIARDGRELAALRGHIGDVQHMAWSPDGTQLAAGDDHGNVWLWPRSGAPGRRLVSSGVAIGTLEFSADGKVVVAGNHAGGLWRWRADGSGQLAVQIDAGVVDLWADAEHVIAVDAAGTVRTWRAGDRLELERTVVTGQPTKRAVFAAGGAWVVLGGISGTATRVEGDATEVIAQHRAQVRYLAITGDGRRIATASDDGLLQIIDRTTGRHIVLRGHAARIRHIAFAGHALLSADGEGVIRRWDLDAIPPRVLGGSGAPVDRLAVAPGGGTLAALDTEGQIVVWTLGDGGRRALGRVTGHASAIALAGPSVVTGSAEGEVAWWPVALGEASAGAGSGAGAGPGPGTGPGTGTGTGPGVRHRVAGIVHAIAVGADRIAVATSAGPIALFSLAGEPLGELPGNAQGTEALAFDPSGAWLASGGQDRVIRVYRAPAEGAPDGAAASGTFAQVAELPGPAGDTHFVAWSPAAGGAPPRLITAGNDGMVYAWQAAPTPGTTAGAAAGMIAGITIDPASRRVLGKHTGAVSGIAVSPDGRWFASGARDDQVIRTALGGAEAGAAGAIATGGAASAIAFDAAGGIQAVTRTGAVVHAAPGDPAAALVIDHGAIGGVAVGRDRFAVALDDGAIVIEQLGPHTLDELTRVLAGATTYRLPAAR
ncbi:MAG TPA: protein kinase, partial [Kofleriaceae bacterium]|nr:protein kinase [Kofleriaceae bacterium]